eukprot:1149428-Pelagomonas_calceolata.AAC.4
MSLATLPPLVHQRAYLALFATSPDPHVSFDHGFKRLKVQGRKSTPIHDRAKLPGGLCLVFWASGVRMQWAGSGVWMQRAGSGDLDATRLWVSHSCNVQLHVGCNLLNSPPEFSVNSRSFYQVIKRMYKKERPALASRSVGAN